jgi:polyhydroxyalkanoate synthesis repressor PhaR
MTGPLPTLLQIRKYPNRRLYDRTRSCHLTHGELYDLVVAGNTVCVTDSKSGADITSLVLAQAVIERNPEKFASIPPEVFHLMIRASEGLLRQMSEGFMKQAMQGMAGFASPPGFASGAGSTGFPWPMPPMPPMPPVPGMTPGPTASADASIADLRSRLEALARDFASIAARQTPPG